MHFPWYYTSLLSVTSSRESIFQWLAENPNAHKDTKLRQAFAEKLKEHEDDDLLTKIGADVFGVDVTSVLKPTTDKTTTIDARIEESGSALKKQGAEKDNDAGDNDVICSFEFMTKFMTDVFLSFGVSEDRAAICADVLVESDRRGIDSHGIGRLKPIYCDRMDAGILKPDMPIDVVRETDTTALLDGNLGIGLYIGPYSMQMAIDKAKKHGVGFVAVQNSTHYGIAGYYATMATQQGCIGWTGTNARPSIAPTFGIDPMLGTNPLCFGIPTDEPFDFVIDCATSINQRGRIELYARNQMDTPRGVVIDENGVERTDTENILKELVAGTCALNPVGGAGEKTAGYKGYSWATVVELLSTAFQSGPFGEDVCGIDRKTGKKKPMPLGHYFLAIDIEALCPEKAFRENAGRLLRALRESRKSPIGPKRIWTAGEREYDAKIEREAQGGIIVNKALQSQMMELRDKRPGLKEKYAKFPWEN